jgi:predicted protein tyrosine phosphatase
VDELRTARSKILPYSLSICGVMELPEKVKAFSPTHVISIQDPDDDPQAFASSVAVLRLAFWDIAVARSLIHNALKLKPEDDFPGRHHAEAILDFGRGIPSEGRLLIHCMAGISRSTAAAFMLVCQHRRGDERRALQFIKVLRPQAEPNAILVAHADAILGADGRMIAALCG